MTKYLALFFALLLPAQVVANGPTVCESPELTKTFIWTTRDNFDYTISIFDPYMPELVTCLKKWVEDGGERDALPLGAWIPKEITPPRLFYRMEALSTITALYREYKNTHPNPAYASAIESLAPWVRSSLQQWPDQLRCLAYTSLAQLSDKEAFAIIEKASRAEKGDCRTFAWQASIMLRPETVSDLEAIAQTEEELRSLDLAILYSNKGGNTTVWGVQSRVKAKLREIELSKPKH